MTKTYNLKQASTLLASSQNLEFARLVFDGCRVADDATSDYPSYCQKYFTEYVPGIYTGEREVIVAYLPGEGSDGCEIAVGYETAPIWTDAREQGSTDVCEDKPVAVAVLTRNAGERKIDALLMRPKYRESRIITALLDRCFAWLGTEHPQIAIPDSELVNFARMIQKYGWQEEATLPLGDFDDPAKKHVFNYA